MKKIVVFTVALLLALPIAAAQQVELVTMLVDEEGMAITTVAYEVNIEDEYISGDNKLYRVIAVEGEKATMQLIGEEEMPVLPQQGDIETFAPTQRPLIGMYMTHSDESYEKGDGVTSDEKQGGIYDVAHELKAQLEQRGVEVILDETTHHPHDAGAYRRSQRTAVEILKQNPAALVDIHRDGIPDPSEYDTQVEGDDVTRVRLLVGRVNPNASANRQFAKTIKAVADEKYPGFIKDIFIGKGNYNQEMAPNSILLEFGTHTSDKQEVLASTEYMAQVLTEAVFGTENLAGGGDMAGESSQGGNNAVPQKDTRPQTDNNANESKGGTGVWTAVFIVLGLAVAGVVIYALASGGGFKNLGTRLSRTTSEVTGGLIGKKPEEREKE